MRSGFSFITFEDDPIPIPSLQAYRSPWVRALAWSCLGPVLLPSATFRPKHPVDTPHLAFNEQRQQWLAKLDEDDRPLRAHLRRHCSSPRLGLVFESLWHFFLSSDPDCELIAHNLAVRDGKRTVGEFDIIYYQHSAGRYFHLELAVKFFLYHHSGEANPLSNWLGPNSADRLDRKLDRLLSHQLPLSRTAIGHRQLIEMGLSGVAPQLHFGGMLFYPPGLTPAPTPALHPNHLRGQWQTVSAFTAKEDIADWRLLAKPDWLAANFDMATPLNTDTLARAQQRPVMLMNGRGQRQFITPDSWPLTRPADDQNR